MYKYVLLRTWYERTSTEFIRQYRRIPAEEGQTHTERKNSVRMASLICSKLAKISCKLL